MAHRINSSENEAANYDSPTKGEMKKLSAKNKKKATLGSGEEGNEFSDADWAPSSRYKKDNHTDKMGSYKRPKKSSMNYSRDGGSY